MKFTMIITYLLECHSLHGALCTLHHAWHTSQKKDIIRDLTWSVVDFEGSGAPKHQRLGLPSPNASRTELMCARSCSYSMPCPIARQCCF